MGGRVLELSDVPLNANGLIPTREAAEAFLWRRERLKARCPESLFEGGDFVVYRLSEVVAVPSVLRVAQAPQGEGPRPAWDLRGACGPPEAPIGGGRARRPRRGACGPRDGRPWKDLGSGLVRVSGPGALAWWRDGRPPRARGARPLTADGRRLGLHRRLALAPRLVPLYLSRFVPEGCGDDPPVLSVSGRRVLCMATGLGDWAAREFRGVSPRGTWPSAPVPVPVWDDLMPAAGQPGGHAAVPAPPRARRAPPPAGAADVARLMAKAGVSLAPGLSRAELSAAERACGAPFPRSLRALLQGAMPASWQGRFPFPDWRC